MSGFPHLTDPYASGGAPRAIVAASLITVLLAVGVARAQAPESGVENAGPAAAVDAFHAALASGDGAGAMRLLAPDAVILEEGDRESRAHYEEHHLPADIAFAKAVPSVRRDEQVTVSGDVAWVSANSESRGRLRDRPVHLVGAELIVLTKSSGAWTIRAIHWSSHEAK
jgi:ketosteroid isomerase-like protein